MTAYPAIDQITAQLRCACKAPAVCVDFEPHHKPDRYGPRWRLYGAYCDAHKPDGDDAELFWIKPQ